MSAGTPNIDRMFAFIRATMQGQSMIDTLRRWQSMESQIMSDIGGVVERTGNPYARIILEIIRHDSLIHHRIQQALIDSLRHGDTTIEHAALDRVWPELGDSQVASTEAIAIAAELTELASGSFQRAMLGYLSNDTHKHHRLLRQLAELHHGPIPAN